MIKHKGQVLDLVRSNPFYTAQRQIIILGTFEADAKTANLADQISSINSEMRDEILRQKKLRVPIGLKMRFGSSILCIQLVLVAVEQLQSAIFV